jgi:hypothetical protein
VIDRRTFIEAGLALPALSLAPGMVLAGATPGALELERFIFDPRFDESVVVAGHVGKLGLKHSPVSDNLMELWYDELDLLWKETPRALAGVTLNEVLFVLETLALDHRMRVVFRGEHSPVEGGKIRHELAGPAAIVEPLAALPAGADWQAALAQALNACPLGEPVSAEAAFVTDAPGLALRDETLYTWIIAPRSAVALTIAS